MRIRKAQVKIEDSVFWFLFSIFLVFIGIFPSVVDWGAHLIGVQSSVNFIFLSIIFILILKLFRMSIRISQLESKLQTFVEIYALKHINPKECTENIEEKNSDK